MEATQKQTLQFLSVALLGAFVVAQSIGCSPANFGSVNSSNLNGQSCAGQAIEGHFLVKWKDAVPAEYQQYKLHPNSLVTRFTTLTKDQVEKQILQTHLSAFE
jgi:hypothetical protein